MSDVPIPVAGLESPPRRLGSGWGAPIIATISVVELIVFAGLAVWLKNDNLMLLIAGAVITNATTAVGFYLGSSHGAQQKDATIAGQLPPPPLPAPQVIIGTTTP